MEIKEKMPPQPCQCVSFFPVPASSWRGALCTICGEPSARGALGPVLASASPNLFIGRPFLALFTAHAHHEWHFCLNFDGTMLLFEEGLCVVSLCRSAFSLGTLGGCAVWGMTDMMVLGNNTRFWWQLLLIISWVGGLRCTPRGVNAKYFSLCADIQGVGWRSDFLPYPWILCVYVRVTCISKSCAFVLS